MKFNFSSFLSGFLAAGILFSVSALAISGRMTIEVDPINVQVNGEVFQPTDVNGKEVPVFAYQGTTYAPLRALAEAYGLEVGYDAAANMATVTDPDVKTQDTTAPDTTAKTDYSDWSAEDEAAYQEFKGMWDVEVYDPEEMRHGGIGKACFATYNGDLTVTELKSQFEQQGTDMIENFASRLMFELYNGEDLLRMNFINDARVVWVTLISNENGTPCALARLDDDSWD